MIRRSKRSESFFCRVLVGSLLFSVLLLGIPSWVQSDEHDIFGDKSSGTIVEVGNPGPAIALVIVPIIWEVVKLLIWPPEWPPSKKKVDQFKVLEDQLLEIIREKIQTEDLEPIRGKLDDLNSLLGREIASREGADTKLIRRIERLENLREEDLAGLRGLIRNLRRAVDEEIESRKETDATHAEDIRNLKSDVRELVPEAKVFIPKMHELLAQAQETIQEMKDRISDIEVMKDQLVSQGRRIENLKGLIIDLKTTLDQEIERVNETIRQEVASLQAVDAGHSRRIENLERMLVEKKRPKRKIRFALAVGGWFSESIEDTIVVYEGRLLISPKVRLFGGGGSDESWISYYGVQYSLGDFLSLGAGGLNSSTFEKTELMYLIGLSHDIGKVMASADYFYVPEEEKSSGTRACLAVRF